MPEWDQVSLGEVLTRSRDTITLDPNETYKQVTVRMKHKGVTLREQKKGAEIGSPRQYVARPGQFIISSIDARNGAMGLVPGELDGAIVTNDFWLFDVDNERLDQEWLRLYSSTAAFVEACTSASEGTTNRVRLKPDRFLQLDIPLPPLLEQQRIVARIKSMLGKVEEVDRLRNESIKQTQLAWATYARKVFSEFNADTPLSDVVKIQGGGTPSKSNPDFWDGDIPWVTPKDMKVRRITSSRDKITPSAINNSSAKIIHSGAILVVTRGMILAHTVPIGLLEIPSAINQDMKALTPKEGILPEFLLNWLWANNNILLSLVDKSTHDTRKLETAKLLSILIPFPGVDQQQKAVDKLDKFLENLTSVSSNQSATDLEIRSLPSSILARAFAGEL